MKFRFLAGLCSLFLLLLAACTPPPPLRDSTLLVDETLLEEGNCTAPCWRGITPGETTWANALNAIDNDETLSNLQVQQGENSATIGASFQNQGGTRPCCQMVTQDGDMVSAIVLQLAPTVTLGEVIDVWGEPTYAVGTPYSDQEAIINVFFPDVPMILYVFIDGTEGSIRESSEIIGALYLTQTDMDLIINTNSLHLWDGYDTYQAYRGDEDAPYDTTPSVTLTPVPEGS
jgi:hypothetical protein